MSVNFATMESSIFTIHRWIATAPSVESGREKNKTFVKLVY
jgi:hypothetical protein